MTPKAVRRPSKFGFVSNSWSRVANSIGTAINDPTTVLREEWREVPNPGLFEPPDCNASREAQHQTQRGTDQMLDPGGPLRARRELAERPEVVQSDLPSQKARGRDGDRLPSRSGSARAAASRSRPCRTARAKSRRVARTHLSKIEGHSQILMKNNSLPSVGR